MLKTTVPLLWSAPAHNPASPYAAVYLLRARRPQAGMGGLFSGMLVLAQDLSHATVARGTSLTGAKLQAWDPGLEERRLVANRRGSYESISRRLWEVRLASPRPRRAGKPEFLNGGIGRLAHLMRGWPPNQGRFQGAAVLFVGPQNGAPWPGGGEHRQQSASPCTLLSQCLFQCLFSAYSSAYSSAHMVFFQCLFDVLV